MIVFVPDEMTCLRVINLFWPYPPFLLPGLENERRNGWSFIILQLLCYFFSFYGNTSQKVLKRLNKLWALKLGVANTLRVSHPLSLLMAKWDSGAETMLCYNIGSWYRKGQEWGGGSIGSWISWWTMDNVAWPVPWKSFATSNILYLSISSSWGNINCGLTHSQKVANKSPCCKSQQQSFQIGTAVKLHSLRSSSLDNVYTMSQGCESPTCVHVLRLGLIELAWIQIAM